MFIGSGTALNVVAIAIGSGIGITLGNRLKGETQKLITNILGLVTLLGAASALIPLWSTSFSVRCLSVDSSVQR
jgi:uncharacterized membrane protein YqgA involved in biofilm formation